MQDLQRILDAMPDTSAQEKIKQASENLLSPWRSCQIL
jgi:hypothetical protein